MPYGTVNITIDYSWAYARPARAKTRPARAKIRYVASDITGFENGIEECYTLFNHHE